MIVITGQTATGKTDLALSLASLYNGEIINFDSRQIYQHLNIITGKDLPKNSKFKVQNSKFKIKTKDYKIGYYLFPYPEAQSFIKLWLYDIVKPNQYFSSYDFVKLAQIVIKDIITRKKTPILIGGSYFYLKHLLYGFNQLAPPNLKLREKLNKKTVSQLQTMLKKISPDIYNSLNHSDVNNPHRLIRRIEIARFTRTVLIRTVLTKRVPTKYIGLRYKNKDDLVKAIKKRVNKRLQKGAIDEVKKILALGYLPTDYGLKTIGYQEIINYLNHKLTKQQAIDQWINHEVQYAKRQITFMKQDKNISWKDI